MTRKGIPGPTRWALAFVMVVACSGSQTTQKGQSALTPDSPAASATISAATGGTVTHPDGVTVSIPPGGLAADTVLSIQRLVGNVPSGTVGHVYTIGPSGTTFVQPATVSFPVPASSSTAVSVWTRSENETQYTSLPTSIGAGMASAAVNHLSIFVLGPIDVTGTWTGLVSYTFTKPDGTAGTGTSAQTRVITQNIGDVTWTAINRDRTVGMCSGTLEGSTLAATCSVASADNTCSATYAPGGTISGTTWVSSGTYTWGGGACTMSGWIIAVPGSTLHKLGSCADTFPLSANGAFTTPVNAEIADFVDIVAGDVTVDSTSISAHITVRNMPASLTFNEAGVPLNEQEYLWQIEFDTDGDGHTDYSMAISHYKATNLAVTGPLLANTQHNVWEYSSAGATSLVAASASLLGNTLSLNVPKAAHPDLANITSASKVRFTTSYRGTAAYDNDCAP